MSIEKTAQPSRRRPGLVGGFLFNLKGIKFLLGHRSLMGLALIPIALNTLVFALTIYFGLHFFNEWLAGLLPDSGAWYWLALVWAARIVLVLVFMGVLVFVFRPLAEILASPFNDALAGRTEFLVTGKAPGPSSLKDILKETSRTVVEELKKLMLLAVALSMVFLFSFIPVIGQMAFAPLLTLVGIFWAGLSYLDVAMARKSYRLGDKIGLMKSNPLPVTGYSVGVFLGFLVPLFNLAFISAAVVGGTLLFLELTEE
ncbi:MAG: EI24 domain-containing protein [Pseudomonadota bacterium]